MGFQFFSYARNFIVSCGVAPIGRTLGNPEQTWWVFHGVMGQSSKFMRRYGPFIIHDFNMLIFSSVKLPEGSLIANILRMDCRAWIRVFRSYPAWRHIRCVGDVDL